MSAQAKKLEPGYPVCFVHHRRPARYIAVVNIAGGDSWANVYACGECLANYQNQKRCNLWLSLPSPESAAPQRKSVSAGRVAPLDQW